MRGSAHRPERLASLLQESIAEAVATELKDPRVGFVTVTGVTVSPDGSHANVRVSVMGSDEDKATAIDALEHARGFLRTHVARTLHLRSVPELHIILDRGLEHAARIDQILHKIKQDEH